MWNTIWMKPTPKFKYTLNTRKNNVSSCVLPRPLWNHPFVGSKLRSLLSWLLINLTKHPCPFYYYWQQKNHAYRRLKIFWPMRSSSNILFSTGVHKVANSTLPPILPPLFPPPISGSLVTAILLKGWILPIGGASAGEGLRLQSVQQACFIII